MADRIVVKVLEAEEVTKGGIVLPDTAKEKPQQAEVIAVGKGRVADDGKVIAPEVKVNWVSSVVVVMIPMTITNHKKMIHLYHNDHLIRQQLKN